MHSDVMCICKEPVSHVLHVLTFLQLVEHALSVVLLPSFSRIAVLLIHSSFLGNTVSTACARYRKREVHLAPADCSVRFWSAEEAVGRHP